MIRPTEQVLGSNNPVVDVYLRRGDQFINKDIPRNPFEIQNHLTFWLDDRNMMVISLNDVKVMHFHDATPNPPINTSK